MKILVGITGASGSIYGLTLIRVLKESGVELSITSTKAGLDVCQYETGIKIVELANELEIPYYDIDNLFTPPASGSYRLSAVVILPCSMGTLSRIAQGISSNLLERSADVILKEKRKLIICPRETPLNAIHLENMLRLSQAGAIIMPNSTAFYTKPKSLEDIIHFHVGKVLDILDIDHTLFNRWGS